MCVERLPCALTEAQSRELGRLDENNTFVSRKLIPKSGRLCCVRSTNDKVSHVVRDGVSTSVSIGRITQFLTGLRARQSSATICGETESRVADIEAATDVGPTVQN